MPHPFCLCALQVAGWRIDYEGLTFATVRNAGHMVPYVQVGGCAGGGGGGGGATGAGGAEGAGAGGGGGAGLQLPLGHGLRADLAAGLPVLQPERAYALFGAFLFDDAPPPSSQRGRQ